MPPGHMLIRPPRHPPPPGRPLPVPPTATSKGSSTTTLGLTKGKSALLRLELCPGLDERYDELEPLLDPLSNNEDNTEGVWPGDYSQTG